MPIEPADELLDRCRQGDQQAWSRLVEEYAALVYSIPRRYRFDDADTNDIFQNVFVSLLKNLNELRDDKALTRWLMTTTHRACWRRGQERSKARRASDVEAILVPAEQDLPLADLQRWEQRHLVDRALRQLGGLCESLLRALFIHPEGANYESVGERLRIPAGSIGPTRRRCLAKLADILAESADFDALVPAEP